MLWPRLSNWTRDQCIVFLGCLRVRLKWKCAMRRKRRKMSSHRRFRERRKRRSVRNVSKCWQSMMNLDYQCARIAIPKEAWCKFRIFHVFVTLSIHNREIKIDSLSNEMLEKCVDCKQGGRGLHLAFRLCCFFLAVFVLWSTFVVRLFGFWLVARSLILTGFFLASATLFFGPLSITVTPFTVIRLILTTPFSIFILGLFQGILRLGRSGLGFRTRTSRPGCRTFASWTWTTPTARWPLLPFLWPGWWSTRPSTR